jgi:hypothetical protein
MDNGNADALEAVLKAVVTAGTMPPRQDDNFRRLNPHATRNCKNIQVHADNVKTKKIGKYCLNICNSVPSLCSFNVVPTMKIGMAGTRILKYAVVHLSNTPDMASAILFAIKKRTNPLSVPSASITSFDTIFGRENEKHGCKTSTAAYCIVPTLLQYPAVRTETAYAIIVLTKLEQQTRGMITRMYLIALRPSFTIDENTSANITNGNEKTRHSLIERLIEYRQDLM